MITFFSDEEKLQEQIEKLKKKELKEIKGKWIYRASCDVPNFGTVYFDEVDINDNRDQDVIIYCIDMNKPKTSQFKKLDEWHARIKENLKTRNTVLLLVGMLMILNFLFLVIL